MSGESHRCENKYRKISEYKSVKICWTIMRLKVKVSWIVSSPDKIKTTVHWVAICKFPIGENIQDRAISRQNDIHLLWRIGTTWSHRISWNPNNQLCYIMTLTKLKAWISRLRPDKKRIFYLQHNNAKLLNSLNHVTNFGWTVLPYQLKSLNLALSDFQLFELMMDDKDNIFLTMILSLLLWITGSPLLVLIAGNKVQLMVLTIWKK